MAEKRVIEYEAASELANDDWLLIDGVTEGTRKARPSTVTAELGEQVTNIATAVGGLTAELVDIRVGANAVTYPSAGGAVRNQISDIKNVIKEHNNYSIGYFVLKHLNAAGALIDNDNKNATFAQPVIALKGSSVYVDNGYKYQIALYDKTSGSFIERLTWKTSEKYVFNDDYLVRLEISDLNESVLYDTTISEHLHYTLINSKNTTFNLKEMAFNPNACIDLDYSIGDTVSMIPNYTTYWFRYCIYDCEENDIFIINARGGSTPRVWAFIDSDNKLLDIAEVSTSGALQDNLLLKAPKNAAKIIINDSYLNGICLAYNTVKSNQYWIKTIKENATNYALKKQTEDVIAQATNILKGISIEAFRNKTMDVCIPNAYTAWPFVGVVNNKLVCLYTRGLTHDDNKTPSIFSKISSDGIVWTLEKQIINTQGKRDTITGKGNNANGDLIFWNRVGVQGIGVKYQLYKTSDGVNITLVSEPTFTVEMGHVGDIISVPNVGLLAFFNTYGNNRKWGIVVSNDDGETWEQTVIQEVSKYECPTEISAVYLGNGKILAIGRRDAFLEEENNKLFQIQSNDYGNTWTILDTNILDSYFSTPSLVLKEEENKLYLYYFQRVVGALRLRENLATDVWDNPTNWANSSIIAYGTTDAENAGNVNAVAFNDIQVAAFYSGDEFNTGIYATII